MLPSNPKEQLLESASFVNVSSNPLNFKISSVLNFVMG